MGWTGVVRTKRFGYVMLGTLVMVDMEIGREAHEYLKSLRNLSPLSHGLEWKMAKNIVK